MINQQRELYEALEQEVGILKYQNQLITEKHQELQTERDRIYRELTFTKADLVRYQHEHHTLSIQVGVFWSVFF